MTGMEILEGLSYVDEKYIQEAETATLGRNTPWMKILSVAACLCILITGAYAYQLFQPKGATESMQEAAAPAAPAATAEAPRQESVMEEAAPEEVRAPAAGELEHIPYARLRILSITDDGYTVLVEEVAEASSFVKAGMELTLVVDPAMVPGADAQIQNDLSNILADTLVRVANGAYDAERNILYAAELFSAE